jgi:hypothetical protein
VNGLARGGYMEVRGKSGRPEGRLRMIEERAVGATGN